MLVVCEPGKEKILFDIYDKWDLECEIIGEVTEGPMLEFYEGNTLVAEVPAESLVLGGGAPVYDREYTSPEYLEKIKAFKTSSIPTPDDIVQTAKKVMSSPNLVSKRWIYEQYDSMVRTNTVTTNAPSDAAVSYVKGTSKAIAMTTDCNPAYVFADPFKGTMILKTHIATCNRRFESPASFAHSFDGMHELPVHFRVIRIAKIETICNSYGFAT